MKTNVEFIVIQREDDKSYDVFERDLATKRLTFKSNHAKKDAALQERDKLKGKPSQSQAIKFARDLATRFN